MNPAPIISRRRDGLNPAHPFVQALRQAAEDPLGRLIAEEAERARRDAGNIESDETRSALDRLARELSRIIGEELRDIEAEELPDTGEGEAPLLAIVPEQTIAYMGEDRTLTVAARADAVAEGDIVQVSTDPTGVVDVLTTAVPLKPHARREDILVGQIRVRPLIEDESTIITAELGDRKADALIEVRSEREIVDDEVVSNAEDLDVRTCELPSGLAAREELDVARTHRAHRSKRTACTRESPRPRSGRSGAVSTALTGYRAWLLPWINPRRGANAECDKRCDSTPW